MSYEPNAKTLHGFSFSKVHNFGMPHLGAFYTGKKVSQYLREEDAVCAICGRPATSTHHVVPRGFAHSWNLYSPNGITLLRAPLFALCGYGTTGCHGKFEHGLLIADWRFDSEDFERMFWEGELMREGILTNDSRLFHYGQWVIQDKENDELLLLRKEAWQI